jgi:hypothetical protein
LNLINEIIWTDLPEGIIGQAAIRTIGGKIYECDIKFNSTYRWSTVLPTPKDAMDVHSVALHELGHWLNLRDLYGNVSGYPTDTDKIMYGYGGYGTQKRMLTFYDSQGLRYIYPGEKPCSAALYLSDAAYRLYVPIINTNPNLWADFQYDPSLLPNMMFRLTGSGETAEPDRYLDCQPSSLYLSEAGYTLHIPELVFDGASYRVDLTHVPTGDGLIWFFVSGLWAN